MRKRKLMIIGLALTMALTGCGKKANTDKATEASTEAEETSEEASSEEVQQVEIEITTTEQQTTERQPLKNATAESLIKGMANNVETGTAHYTMDMSMVMSMELGEEKTPDITTKTTMDIKQSKDVAYMSGTVTAEMPNEEGEVETETQPVTIWQKKNGSEVKVWSQNPTTKQWESTASNEYNIDNYVNNATPEMFDNLNMEETEDGYKVTGEFNSKNALGDTGTQLATEAATEAVNEENSEAEGNTEETATEEGEAETEMDMSSLEGLIPDIKFLAELEFDKTGLLKKETLKLKEPMVTLFTIKEYNITINVLDIMPEELTVPEEVAGRQLTTDDPNTTANVDASSREDQPLYKAFGISIEDCTIEKIQASGGDALKNADSAVLGEMVTLISTYSTMDIYNDYLKNFTTTDIPENRKKAVGYLLKTGWISFADMNPQIVQYVNNLP